MIVMKPKVFGVHGVHMGYGVEVAPPDADGEDAERLGRDPLAAVD